MQCYKSLISFHHDISKKIIEQHVHKIDKSRQEPFQVMMSNILEKTEVVSSMAVMLIVNYQNNS